MSVVLRALELAISEAEKGDSDFIADIEDRRSPRHWAQATWEHFNISLSGDTLPSLGAMPPLVSLESWAPRKYVTLSHAAENLPELASFLEKAIERCWDVGQTELALKSPA